MTTNTITKAEWEIMRILWAESPLTSREILNRACAILEWKEGTVKSLLSRLAQKQLITKNVSSTPYLFVPCLSMQDAILTQMGSQLEQTCTKKRGTYMKYLLEQQPLSQRDCDTLIALLQKRKLTAPQTIVCMCPTGQCQCHL